MSLFERIKPGIVFRAIEFSARAHRGQYRKGTRLPYFSHPMNAASILIRAGATDEMVAAAILHDTVEDTPVTIMEIKREFGSDVGRMVAAATEKPKVFASWKERKNEHVGHIPKLAEDEAAVICADKLDNILSILTDINEKKEEFAQHNLEAYSEGSESLLNRRRDHYMSVFERFRAPYHELEWYYRSLAEAFAAYPFSNRLYKRIAERFADAVNNVFILTD
ncbi:MAG: HD domain-containing protein [Bacteroidota bacterium]